MKVGSSCQVVPFLTDTWLHNLSENRCQSIEIGQYSEKSLAEIAKSVRILSG